MIQAIESLRRCKHEYVILNGATRQCIACGAMKSPSNDWMLPDLVNEILKASTTTRVEVSSTKVFDGQGLLESSFSSDTNCNSEWSMKLPNDKGYLDFNKVLEQVDGRVVRITIELVVPQVENIK